MPETWDAEWPIDVALARTAIAQQFPALESANVEPFSWGFDNAAFLVDGTWVFRFPRRTVAVPLLEREARILPALAPRVPVPIPFPEFIGRPSEVFAHPFTAYRRLRGTTACRANLSPEQHATLAEPLARFVSALHAFPVAEATRLGVEPDPLGRLDIPSRTEKAQGLLAEIQGRELVTGDAHTRCERILAETPSVGAFEPVLLHGDLYSRHLLVEDGKLAGVIDWGDVHVGHRASDLSIAWSFLPARARERFRDAYGAVDDTTWLLARFRALCHSLYVLRFAHTIGDADLLRESRWGLACLQED